MNQFSIFCKASKAFLILGLCLLCSFNVSAQAAAAPPAGHLTMVYIKVAPNKIAEYLKMEKAYKKLHAASKKAGNLDDWSLWEIISPWGADCEYNYVAHNRYTTDEQYANSIEGIGNPKWKSLLTPAEVALVNRTDEIRTVVKVEVYSLAESIFPEGWSKKGKIAMFNYFANGEGKTLADHIKTEKDIWMPIHTARIDDGKMTAWWLLSKELPFGSSMPYNSISVDLYADMKSYLANWDESYVKKVHPSKNVDDMMKQTRETTDLVKGELRMVIDRLNW